jgi:eukaryotic-like serine/threonine-protein kinase
MAARCDRGGDADRRALTRMEQLGKYEIRGVLGRGAMGTVYEGWDPQIARRVAIKTVRLADGYDAEEREQLERFRQEAQAAGRLHHPNIVGVFNYAETDELAYIVMEFVDGRSLKAMLESGDRPGVSDVVRIMDGLLAGLDHSHRHQVIHRDIKPANVIITPDGVVKIADFGIARIGVSTMTQAGTIMGTPAYMSPEQFEGVEVDTRTDLYSAGVVLFQLLTGQRPFDGSMATIMNAVLNKTPARPSEISKDVPAALDAVVARAMARKPEDRFATASAFNQSLQQAVAMASSVNDDQTIIASVARPPRQTAPASSPPRVPGRPAEAVRRPRRMILGGCVAAAVLLAGGGLLWLRLDHSPPPSPLAPIAAPSPPAPIAAPATPSAESIRQAIATAVRTVPCSVVAGDYSPGGVATLRGVVVQGESERILRRAVEGAGATIAWQVVAADGPYCTALDIVRPFARPFGSSDNTLDVSLIDDRMTLVDHELIIPRATMPDFASYLRLDYIAADGVVVHLYQTSGDPPYAGLSTHMFGQPTAQFEGWKVGPPFGTDLIVGIASSVPLFPAPRPQMDVLDGYLSDLRAALDVAARGGARISATVTQIRTSP